MEKFDLLSFLYFAIAMTLLMAGNAFSGAMKARKNGSFDWNILKDGCINYGLWLLTALCGAAGFQIYGGDLNVTISEKTYTLLQGIELAKKTVYVYWGAKLLENVFQYGGIKKTAEAIDPQDTFEKYEEIINADEGQG